MVDTPKAGRGASYPVVNLEKAVSLTQKILAAIGKAPTTKLNLAKALGYSGINGKSNRVTAALGQYGLLAGRGDQYRLSDLALQVLFPESEEDKREALLHAATRPALFQQLIGKFQGSQVPALLSNILVTSHSINPNSAEDAASVFKSTLRYVGLLDDTNTIISADNAPRENIDRDLASVESEVVEGQASYIPSVGPAVASTGEGDSLNRIEFVLREGVKAGIYAPHNLTDSEKQKLKTIIDLL